MSDIAYTLLYRGRNHKTNEIEDIGYIWSFGDNSCAWAIKEDIKQAVFRECSDSFTNTIIGEYETLSHTPGFCDEIKLVTVKGKWSSDHSKFTPEEIISVGEDLLKQYQYRKKELEKHIEEIELNIPMSTGYSYLIRNRDDLVKLQEYYPLLDDLYYKLYGHEGHIIKECDYDEEKYTPKINEYRENFFVCGNIFEEDLHVPLIINLKSVDYSRRSNYHNNISIYSVEEIEEQTKTYLNTLDKIKNLIK